jgi:hypothetical protein
MSRTRVATLEEHAELCTDLMRDVLGNAHRADQVECRVGTLRAELAELGPIDRRALHQHLYGLSTVVTAVVECSGALHGAHAEPVVRWIETETTATLLLARQIGVLATDLLPAASACA